MLNRGPNNKTSEQHCQHSIRIYTVDIPDHQQRGRREERGGREEGERVGHVEQWSITDVVGLKGLKKAMKKISCEKRKV